MLKTILATTSAALIASTIALPAHAGLSINGNLFNGTLFNGSLFNGLSINGLAINGLAINGVEQGAGGLVLEAIELPPKAE